MTDKNHDPQWGDEAQSVITPRPLEPGYGLSESGIEHQGSPSPNRADSILVLGILSLFVCWPVGIVAWIMANSDLRDIRAGRMSPGKVGNIRVGRALGIAGTTLFAGWLILMAVLIGKGAPVFMRDIFSTEPLTAKHMVFAGKWVGEKGTVIDIQPNGRGAYKTKRSSVSGGRVRIEGDSLSIGLFGLSNTWRIETRPHLENGMWKMKLDREVFTRKVEGVVAGLGHARPNLV